MKRRGSILITTLLVFVVVLMGAVYVLHSSTSHMLIAKNNSVSNQAYYSAEKKTLLALFEDKYYNNQLGPIIMDYFRGATDVKTNIVIDKADLDYFDTNNLVTVSFEKRNNRQCINLTCRSVINNQSIKVSSVYSIVNDLYELGLPIIDKNYINEDQEVDLNNLIFEVEKELTIDNLPRHMTGISSFDCEKIVVNTNKNRISEISFFRNNIMIRTDKYTNPINGNGKELAIVIRDKYKNNVEFHIDSPNNRTPMTGILYLEGDLIIHSEFIFNGIIIINNGKIVVDSEIKPQINGIIIGNGEEGWINPDELILKYDTFYICRYGSYLPNFLNYKFVVMKRTK